MVSSISSLPSTSTSHTACGASDKPLEKLEEKHNESIFRDFFQHITHAAKLADGLPSGSVNRALNATFNSIV